MMIQSCYKVATKLEMRKQKTTQTGIFETILILIDRCYHQEE